MQVHIHFDFTLGTNCAMPSLSSSLDLQIADARRGGNAFCCLHNNACPCNETYFPVFFRALFLQLFSGRVRDAEPRNSLRPYYIVLSVGGGSPKSYAGFLILPNSPACLD